MKYLSQTLDKMQKIVNNIYEGWHLEKVPILSET